MSEQSVACIHISSRSSEPVRTYSTPFHSTFHSYHPSCLFLYGNTERKNLPLNTFTQFCPATHKIGFSSSFESMTIHRRRAMGFRIACYMAEGVLQSTLECLFNAKCVQMLATILPMINSTDRYLLKSNETKFSPNTSIETIVNAVFVENWFTTSSFSNYYTKCAPISCTYTFTQRGSVIFVITTLLGIFGGLTIVLRLVIFNLVRWWYKRFIGPREPSKSSLILFTSYDYKIRSLFQESLWQNVLAQYGGG